MTISYKKITKNTFPWIGDLQQNPSTVGNPIKQSASPQHPHPLARGEPYMKLTFLAPLGTSKNEIYCISEENSSTIFHHSVFCKALPDFSIRAASRQRWWRRREYSKKRLCHQNLGENRITPKWRDAKEACGKKHLLKQHEATCNSSTYALSSISLEIAIQFNSSDALKSLDVILLIFETFEPTINDFSVCRLIWRDPRDRVRKAKSGYKTA